MAKQTIDELAVIITANASRVPGDLAKAKKEFEKFVKDVANAHPPPPKPPDMRPHRQAAKEAGAVRAAAQAAGESITGFVAKVAATGGTILAFEAGLGGIAGAFQQIKDSVKQAADFEQTAVSFEVMLGSAKRAQQMMADIRRYAATSPFNSREITGAARQLVAYGFAADQVMPSIRMLGDVSAATQKPIEELTYLYGTLRAQGRAYAIDIRQFANPGIPIYEELARVLNKPQFEVKSLIEEGRVTFEDVEVAFRNMTAEGGRYFQMTQRQGQTTAGVLEQMRDAFDLTKLEFGKALIEELGIKDGARDLEAFAARLRENVNELRPAIRFTGDLARAGAQLSYEFSRAGLVVGSMNLDAMARTFPGLKEAADSFHQMVQDAKSFKIDDEKLIDFGADVADLTVRTFAAVADTVRNLWNSAEAHAAPLLRTMERLNEFSQWLAANRSGPTAAPDRATLFPGYGVVDRSIPSGPAVPIGRRDGSPINRFSIDPPMVGMSVDRIRAEWEGLNSAVADSVRLVEQYRAGVEAGRLAPYLLREREQALADAHRRRFEFQSGFVGNPLDVQQWLNAGQVPPIRGGWGDPATARGLVTPRDTFMAGLGPAGLFEPRVKSFAETAREVVEEMRQTMLAAVRLRREAEAAASDRGLSMRAAVGPAALFPADPDVAARHFARIAALGSIAAAPPAPPIRPEVAQLGLDIRREYDPRPELEVLRRQLNDIRGRQLLGPNTDALVERAWRDRLGQAAGKLGIDTHGRYQLPEATAVGSAEDARIITAWRTEGQRPTSEQLWQRIAQAVETLVQIETQRGVRLPVAPAPRVVQLPGE